MDAKNPNGTPENEVPYMRNIIVFATLALAGLGGVLTIETLTGASFGEAEWGIINLVLGGIIGYGSGALQMHLQGPSAPKE